MELFLAQLGAFLAKDQIVTAPDRLKSYSESPRGFFENTIEAALLPNSTEQVAKIMQLALKYKQPIIPQGGNTGLVGGQQALAQSRNVVLSLTKLNKIIAINKYDFIASVEAGVVLADLHEALEQEDLFFPLTLASQYKCQIGGNLASNAGGLSVVRYGSMRDLCLGLEVVLFDGTVLDDMRIVRKDNMGYDLKNLFIGSEGTLGIITKANLKLYPKPRHKNLCYIAFDDITKVLDFYRLARQKAEILSYELISAIAMQLALNYLAKHNRNGAVLEQKAANWYVLLEVANSYDELVILLEEAFEKNMAIDVNLAKSLKDVNYFWLIRESLSAAQKDVNVSIKNDIALPLCNMAPFLAEASMAIKEGTIVCFGHIGDGNLHYNILAPQNMGKAFLARWNEITNIINELVIKYNGSISAEHGIGQLKTAQLQKFKHPIAYKLMRAIKQQLDPYNILNPKKLFC